MKPINNLKTTFYRIRETHIVNTDMMKRWVAAAEDSDWVVDNASFEKFVEKMLVKENVQLRGEYVDLTSDSGEPASKKNKKNN